MSSMDTWYEYVLNRAGMSAADWQSTLTTDVKRYPNGYDVSGTVSAENDFGVKTDYYFRCTEDKQFNILRSGISPQ